MIINKLTTTNTAKEGMMEEKLEQLISMLTIKPDLKIKLLEIELNHLREENAQLKERLERIEMSKVEILDSLDDELTENYRLDAEEKEDGEWWLEELDDDGLPTENYISVSDEQLEQLKANGQIWSYSDDLECWVKPPEGE